VRPSDAKTKIPRVETGPQLLTGAVNNEDSGRVASANKFARLRQLKPHGPGWRVRSGSKMSAWSDLRNVE
jgi:hypothetical protein